MKDQETKDQRQQLSQQEPSEPLTTKEMAAAAARRAPVTQEPRTDLREEQNASQAAGGAETNAALFGREETEEFRLRWNAIQVQFVDEPRKCVERADELVAQTMKRLAEIFAQEREKLEQEWDRGDNISTEDLRIALQRYRSFFDRLLSV